MTKLKVKWNNIIILSIVIACIIIFILLGFKTFRWKMDSNDIKKQIDDIKEDASGDKSWTLTPEQEKAFNERQKDVVDKAKKKAREDLVKKGKTAKNANKDAQTEYKKLQREDDEDFTL